MALAWMRAQASDNDVNGVLGGPKTKPKAKRVIYLFQSGGPSQFELFDNKPYLRENHGVELPTSERGRETGMSSHQASIPMAGGGIKGGITVDHTNKYGAKIVDADGNPVHASKHHYHKDAIHVHDLQATILNQLGIDHETLSYKFQGRRFRLTDVHGKVVKHILA